MISDYKVITITHKSADLKDIGQYVLPASESGGYPALGTLKKRMGIPEMLYLATCNRVLFFFTCPQSINDDFLSEFHESLYLNTGNYSGDFIHHEGINAVRHLFEVAASVDSLVVGEREIIRQLRAAYDRCRQEGLTGDSIRLAINAAIRAGKKVYANTRIGEKQVSIVSLAIKKMLERDLPTGSRILLVGAGQTNALVSKFLKKYGYSNVAVFNRTQSKADELAHFLGGTSHSISELSAYEGGFDCMLVCTGATEPIITPWIYQQLLAGETDRKTIIDLAIPNNVAPEVIEQSDFHYVEIEGLKALAQKNLAFRAKEVERAKDILEEEWNGYQLLYRERLLERTFSDMPKRIKEVKAKALNEVFAKEMHHLDEQSRSIMMKMMDYMERKCVGIPMKVAKENLLR